MADDPRPLSALGTFRQPTRPAPPARGPYGPPEAPPPAPLAFLAPWLEGAVDVVRGGLWGSEGAGDTAAAKTAELLAAGLPLLPLKALGFFSRVDKAVDLIPAKGAHPNKVASLLKSNASAEELAYRNVPEFLAGKGNATVTRAELAAHLAAHPAPVPVVKTRGSSTDPAHVYAARNFLENGATPEQTMMGLQLSYPTARPGDLSDALLAARDPTFPAAPTKYGQYTVPGGEAYRETLVTLPPPPKPNQAALEAEIQAGQARLQELYQQAEGLSRRGPDALKPVWAEIEDLQTHHRNLMRELSADPPTQFRFGHFEEPNILVHTRANERTLPTGERGRFVEELQSDWHQKGKKEGYGPEQRVVAYYELPPMGQSGVVGVVPVGYGKTEAAALANVDPKWKDLVTIKTKTETLGPGGPPDAPFKQAWPELGLKQQVLEAADDPAAQWIGFTGGQTQADRYDLSKRFSEVHYSGTNLKAYDLDGNEVISQTGVSAKDLPDYIGDEGAEKLLAQPKQGTLQSLTGVDLQVGGKGMKVFYDEILPKRLEKIVKPFGGTVERGTLETPLYDLDTQTKNLSGELAMWYARLTPEMKDRIRKEGLPLLSLLPLGVLGHYGQPPAQEPTR